MQIFDSAFFVQNRRRLCQSLDSNGVIILTANGAMQRGIDSAFNFEQEANFWYLTGIDEADWRLIIDIQSGEEWLISPEISASQQIFDGSLSPYEAMHISDVKKVLNKREGLQKIRQLALQRSKIYSLKPFPRRIYGFYTNRAQHDLIQQLKPAKVEDIRLPLAKLRAIKQSQEIEALQNAIDITVLGIKNMLADLAQYQTEYEIEARLSWEFRRQGASGHAYDPIVAGGKNACTLHYGANKSDLKQGDLLLFDVGARFNHYNADITRTVPISEPTDRQRAVYEACLKVHDKAVDNCRPGQKVSDYLQIVDMAMAEELVRLDLIKNNDDKKGLREYFPHAISHGLGIDVHDPLGRAEVLAENMVLTVEPGIYIPEEGIGVRIEDDVLITASGPKVLSGDLSVNLI